MIKINILSNEKDIVDFAAGTTIFASGDEGDFMFYVAEGEVDILVNGAVIETVPEGSIFGEMALIDKDQPRSAQAIAKTDVKLAQINELRFKYLVQQTPFFAIQVMRIMTSRLRKMNSLVG